MAMLQVPVVKGKASVEIDTDKIPQDVYEYALLLGLKTLVNRGMSKVTKSAHPDEAELKAKAMEIAEKQVQDILAGKVRMTGASKSKVSGAVKTEAMRIARNLVKDELKRAKIKISHVDAKDITAAAKALVESDPDIIAKAEAAVKERESTPIKIDIKSIAKVNPAKKAKDDAEKADKPLSAKQAGKTATRAKPGSKAPAAQPQQG